MIPWDSCRNMFTPLVVLATSGTQAVRGYRLSGDQRGSKHDANGEILQNVGMLA